VGKSLLKNMKTVGIIGGLGPETTAQFYMQLVSLCAKKNKTQRPNILIANVPISLKLEEKFINRTEGKREFCALLTNAAKTLEKGGADFIVVPCNTAHVFIDRIRNSVNIPVLSIIDETIKVLKSRGVRKTGLLATPSTIKNRLFDGKIDLIKPSKINQQKMGLIISSILRNQRADKNRFELLQIINSLSEKSDALLLACTDLQLLIPEKEINGLQIFDTMQILADATAREILTPKQS
jgi:aspartate racemase